MIPHRFPSPVPRGLSSTRMQHLRDPEGTFSPTGSGMVECSAKQSTETPQRDSKASMLSADNSLLSWTWLLRETGQQGGKMDKTCAEPR